MIKRNHVGISISSASIGFSVADQHLQDKGDRFRVLDFWQYPIWDKVIRQLRKIGFTVIPDPDTKKNYPILLPYHKYGNWKGLEVNLEIYYTGFRLEFFQNINTGDRKPGDGRYAFDKYDLMPYLIRKRFEYTAANLSEFIGSLLELEVSYSDRPKKATDAILNACQNNHWKRGNPSCLDDIGNLLSDYDRNHNSTDRDKKHITCGEVKYFRHWNGRLYRGTVYHHINNMWWVRINDYWYSNVASFNLFDLTSGDLRQRRVREDHMPAARRKELEFLNSISTAMLRKLLRRKTKMEGGR